ncbi:class I SAM-dependent methyltransferase [Savagea faecisuis]|uniref:Class I SAM-dependent methyltransferase n=1 Tax=Savagea faecisuis TaxID=1274803 RepID=A0ABW3GYL9_9BACL
MSTVETLFHQLDEESNEKEGVAYLEHLLTRLEQLNDAEKVGTKEERRKAVQLALIKGMKQSTQSNHQMTPDALGMLMSYFIEKWTERKKELVIADLAVGTSNLLLTVMNHLDHKTIQGYGVEIDDLLLRIGAAASDFVEQPITYYCQDSLRPLYMDPVDVIVSDLPVGYYPDDENGLNYRLMPTEGHAYAHHLFIEQTLNYLKEDGVAVLLVPNHLFDSEQSDLLYPFFKSEGTISALFQLPPTLFKDANQGKSILVIEKEKRKKDVLLATVPDLSDANAMARFFAKVHESTKNK